MCPWCVLDEVPTLQGQICKGYALQKMSFVYIDKYFVIIIIIIAEKNVFFVVEILRSNA